MRQYPPGRSPSGTLPQYPSGSTTGAGAKGGQPRGTERAGHRDQSRWASPPDTTKPQTAAPPASICGRVIWIKVLTRTTNRSRLDTRRRRPRAVDSAMASRRSPGIGGTAHRGCSLPAGYALKRRHPKGSIMAGYITVLTTTDSAARAEELARAGVSARVAACAQIDGPIKSVYWWEGSVRADEEWRVLYKPALPSNPRQPTTGCHRRPRRHHPRLPGPDRTRSQDSRHSCPARHRRGRACRSWPPGLSSAAP